MILSCIEICPRECWPRSKLTVCLDLKESTRTSPGCPLEFTTPSHLCALRMKTTSDLQKLQMATEMTTMMKMSRTTCRALGFANSASTTTSAETCSSTTGTSVERTRSRMNVSPPKGLSSNVVGGAYRISYCSVVTVAVECCGRGLQR